MLSNARAGVRRRIAVWLGLIGVLGLALLGFACGLTYEPAPRIRVRWREGATPQQRAALERKYLLVHGAMAVTGLTAGWPGTLGRLRQARSVHRKHGSANGP